MKGRSPLSALVDAGPRPEREERRRAKVGGLALIREEISQTQYSETALPGEAIVELDPKDIDPSFVNDRIESDDEDALYTALRESIAQNGQSVPVLVRPKTSEAGRFEVVFGRRRIKASAELGIKVKSIVRNLSDRELVLALGIENNERKDPSFIEKALYALRLKEMGFPTKDIELAVGLRRTDVSTLTNIAQRVGGELILAIGPAPKIGRPRWYHLVGLIDKSENRAKAMVLTTSKEFQASKSDARFEVLLKGLVAPAAGPEVQAYKAEDGSVFAEIRQTPSGANLTVKDKEFALFIQQRVGLLLSEFLAART